MIGSGAFTGITSSNGAPAAEDDGAALASSGGTALSDLTEDLIAEILLRIPPEWPPYRAANFRSGVGVLWDKVVGSGSGSFTRRSSSNGAPAADDDGAAVASSCGIALSDLTNDPIEELLLRFEPSPRICLCAADVCKSWRRIFSDPGLRRRYAYLHRAEIIRQMLSNFKRRYAMHDDITLQLSYFGLY
jgi:hypothetical protein